MKSVAAWITRMRKFHLRVRGTKIGGTYIGAEEADLLEALQDAQEEAFERILPDDKTLHTYTDLTVSSSTASLPADLFQIDAVEDADDTDNLKVLTQVDKKVIRRSDRDTLSMWTRSGGALYFDASSGTVRLYYYKEPDVLTNESTCYFQFPVAGHRFIIWSAAASVIGIQGGDNAYHIKKAEEAWRRYVGVSNALGEPKYNPNDVMTYSDARPNERVGVMAGVWRRPWS
jgi:hypothetical protein